MMISNHDIFICEAFRQILATPLPKLIEKLGSVTPLTIANYLKSIPLTEQLNAAKMANHIAAFCEQPAHTNLNEWLGEIYDSLDDNGIAQLVKKTGDPGDEIDLPPPENPEIIANEGRDICQFLQDWATEMQNQSNQGSQNVSNSTQSN